MERLPCPKIGPIRRQLLHQTSAPQTKSQTGGWDKLPRREAAELRSLVRSLAHADFYSIPVKMNERQCVHHCLPRDTLEFLKFPVSEVELQGTSSIYRQLCN